MANALDYIVWRGDLEFDRDPVNEIDMFLFSQLATPDYSGILGPKDEMPLSGVMKKYFELHTDDWKELGLLQSKCVIPMMKQMAQCPRFRDMRLAAGKQIIRLQKTEQFEAMTILPTDGLSVISYRGTDDTLVGWKEDMYLAVVPEVAAQRDALSYLREIAERYPEGKIRVVGHSKGGNLAIYAAVNAPEEVRKRIELVVGYDSPGFPDEFVSSEAYLRMKSRIITVISQNSLVGMLMNLAGKYSLVRSAVAGPYAHDGFNWEVAGKQFRRANALSSFSLSLGTAVYDTLSQMDAEHKEEFIEELFRILEKNGSATVTEFYAQSLRDKTAILGDLMKSSKVRRFGRKIAKELEKANRNRKEIRTLLEENFEDADSDGRKIPGSSG